VDTDVRSNPFCTQLVSHEPSLINLPYPHSQENTKNDSMMKEIGNISEIPDIKKCRTALSELTLALL
jgi:hypothetical protein